MQTTHSIIVNYNAGNWLQRSLNSALSFSNGVVTLVDNASSDNSVVDAQQACPSSRIDWQLNSQNLGFAAANNQVLKTVSADFAVLLNPDCELQETTLPTVLKHFEVESKLGLISCAIFNETGQIQATSKRRFPTPWSAFVRIMQLHRVFPNSPKFANFDYGDQSNTADQLQIVEAISGAFMVVRMSALQDVGLLDEGYFMHCEDLDWCKRFELAGWQVGFVPNTRVIHAQGVSTASRPIGVLWTLHKGMLRFFDKFYFEKAPVLLRYLIKLGVALSFLARVAVTLIKTTLVKARKKSGEN